MGGKKEFGLKTQNPTSERKVRSQIIAITSLVPPPYD